MTSKIQHSLHSLNWQLQTLALRVLLALLRGRSHHTMQRVVHQVVRQARPLISRRIAAACINLDRVYGDSLAPVDRNAIAERSLEHFLLSCLESIIQPVDDQIFLEGEGLRDLLKRPQNKGAIVASLHLGCWDLALRGLSKQLNNVAVVYRPLNNKEADQLLNRARSSNSHCTWISRSNARAMLSWLRQGGTLVVMTDLHDYHNWVEVDMLGLATRISSGPFRLSQMTGCPIFPAAQFRENNSSFKVIFGRQINPLSRDKNLKDQAQKLCDWHEAWIQQYSEQYLWAYPRWRAGEGGRIRPKPIPSSRVLELVRA